MTGSAGVISTQQFFGNNGKPLAGGKLYTYLAGTTTNTTTWTDAALTVENTNPIILDSAGRCSLFLDGAVMYKFVLKTSTGVTIWTADNQQSNGNTLVQNAYTDAYKSLIASSAGASNVGFIQSGTGAVADTVERQLKWLHVDITSFMTDAQRNDYVSGALTLDLTAPIQNAINYSVYTTFAPKKVFFPTGLAKTTDTLHIGYGTALADFDYASIIVEGQESFGMYGTRNLSGIRPTFNDRPAINIQGGRGVRIKKLAVKGVNYDWLQSNDLSITDRSVLANWAGPSMPLATSNKRYAPYAGICIDAYSGTTPPTPYPDVVFPSFIGSPGQYGKNYSSGTVIEDCQIGGFAVGVITQPGVVNDGSQGDFTTLRDCTVEKNLVASACGNADNRTPNYYNCQMWGNHTVFDGLTYGNQHGSMAVNANGCCFDQVYRIFNIDLNGYTVQGGYNARLEDCYGEGLYSIGYAGEGETTTSTGGLSISESKFAFSVRSGEYSPIYLYYAPRTELYLRNVLLNGGYAFHNLFAIVTADNLAFDNVIGDVFNSGGTQEGKKATSYLCNFFAYAARSVNVRPIEFYDYFGNNLAKVNIDSEGFNIDKQIENGIAAFAQYGTPIPWFTNQLKYGKSKFPVSDVAPLVLNRATYNLSSQSVSNNEHTFTVNTGFITDSHGANTDPAFNIGIGDFVRDDATGIGYFVKTVSFTGSGGSATATMTLRQISAVRLVSGTTYTCGNTIAASAGTLTFYNSRRVYPSNYRVHLSTTSGSGNGVYKVCGDETAITCMTLPMRVNDYLISNARSQCPNDSAFPKFSKVTAVDVNAGTFTVNQNARRTLTASEAILVVRGS